MPNISSMITDIATSAITSKLSGQNKKDPKDHSSGGLNLSSALSQVSTIFSSSSPLSKQKQGDNSMSGYPNNNPYGQGYPQQPFSQQPSGYPQQAGYGSQPSQPYPPHQQSGYSDAYGAQQPGYPPQQPGYPTSGGQPSSIGFNVGGSGNPAGQPPYPANSSSFPAYSPYEPNVSSGYGGNSQPYPSQGPPSSGYGGNSQPYPSQGPPSSGYGSNYPPQSGVYPIHAADSLQQQFYGQPPSSHSSSNYSGSPSIGKREMFTPTIKPNPNFNAAHQAEMLRKAMKGFGCNKDKVIQALTTICNWQRQEVAKSFKQQYGKDLITDLKSELSGDFEDLVLALMEPPARYDAQQLHRAMAGLGTKESVLIEIMTTRSNAQIQELKLTYKQLFGNDLEKDLIGETSGNFKRLLISLCCGGRDESYNVDPLKANQDARRLYSAGERRLGTDESTFNAILAAQNFAQLRLVFQEYQTVSGHSIEQAINSEFSGDIRDGLLAIVKSIRNRPAYFAELIHNSMVGLGTRDNDLIRLIVTRSELDLGDVRNVYPSLFKSSLEKAIAGDCSGSYKEGLIAVVKGN